jgi:CTP synthase (UTP-ammonia lyase)
MPECAVIGLIGDYSEAVVAHRAIPLALHVAAEALNARVELQWVGTSKIDSTESLARYDGLWCVPGSPYHDLQGALLAIRYARETRIPFLGTCGGFQHALIEYARNVLGWHDADHAESAPQSRRPVINELECPLVETAGQVRFLAGTRLAQAYGRRQATEMYHCRYGLNPEMRTALLGGTMRVAAEDEQGEVRGVELVDHPFFIATLFQSERKALRGETPPLVRAFLRASLDRSGIEPKHRIQPEPA